MPLNTNGSLSDCISPAAAVKVRRSKNGCQQCRHRKRKCDEQRPRCAACVKRDLHCGWERSEVAKVRSARRSTRYNRDYELPQEMRSLFTVFAAPSASIKERLMAHFNAASPLWLTIGGEARRTAMLNIVMPAALQNPLICECLLAVAAGDMSKYEPSSSEMHSLANGFYGQAIAGVQSAVSQEYALLDSACPSDQVGETLPAYTNDNSYLSRSGGDDTLLAILLLCVHEAQNFTKTDRLLPHINAAAMICHKRFSRPVPGSYLRALLFEIFCYFFTLAAFSHGHQLQLHLAPQIFNSPFLSIGHSQGILLAPRCRRVFSCILKVAKLENELVPRTGPHLERILSELRELEAQLDSKPALLCEDVQATVSHEDTLSELFRIACVIYVKKVLDPELVNQHKTVQGLLEQFLTHLNNLPQNSPENSILIWPLVVAGMSAIAVSHQRLIVGRLRAMYIIWRTDIITKTVETLNKVWRESKAQDGIAPYSLDVNHQIPAQGRTLGRHKIDYNIVFL